MGQSREVSVLADDVPPLPGTMVGTATEESSSCLLESIASPHSWYELTLKGTGQVKQGRRSDPGCWPGLDPA